MDNKNQDPPIVIEKNLIKEKTYQELIHDTKLTSANSKDRITQVASRKKIVKLSEKVLSNADTGAETLSYLLFGLFCTQLQKGEYLSACVFLVVSILAAIIRFRIPEGPISTWLKKPVSELAEDVRETFSRKK